ncbi:MAG: VWA domain-containing protein [Sporichthyaceae bacterium]
MTDARDVHADLAAVAARLRAHPDVLAGPSVRAMLAAAELHESLATVAGGDSDLHRLVRACLIALPHRLRVAAGVDAARLVVDAVLDSLDAADEPDEDSEDAREDPTAQERGVYELPVFRLETRGNDAEPGGSVGPSAAAFDLGALLDRILQPTRRPGPAEGTAPSPVPPLAGERSVPVPLRPGDRLRELSVRATQRAALRRGIDLTDDRFVPPEVLRRRPPHPRVTCDVVLALDVSESMTGGAVGPLARALVEDATRAGHRVALQVFAAVVTDVCGLSRRPQELLAAARQYTPANPTNLEFAVWAATDLLLRTGWRAHPGVIVLVTDAEPTICGTAAAPARGHGVGTSRIAALDAAAKARAAGLTLSVLYPPPGSVARVDPTFAAALAGAGGGIAHTYPVH